MFLCAKTASAASAALGFAGYLLAAVRLDLPLAVLGVATAVVMTLVVLAGVRLSSRVNMVVVSVTLASLAAFVIAGLPAASAERLAMRFEPRSVLHATALVFVAFTGYGRLATLGEEVVEPRRTIPRAIVVTLVVAAALYLAVAGVYVGAGGADAKPQASDVAPLEAAARGFPLKVAPLIVVGAMAAMLGVLLNLLLGLSRVLLAMGRRGDMPRATADVHVAVITVGMVIAGLAALGDVKTTWSFSAFTVLIYYAVTNLAALRLTAEERLFSRWWAWGGLIACLALAFAVEWRTWAAGLGVLAVGMAWHAWRQENLAHRR
jgi:APA family basic amino acid/polyamine antiporter